MVKAEIVGFVCLKQDNLSLKGNKALTLRGVHSTGFWAQKVSETGSFSAQKMTLLSRDTVSMPEIEFKATYLSAMAFTYVMLGKYKGDF